ncbi:enoyl-CoA hydratase/isomerase family protein [Alteribacillus sp. YIM 98480]|uniref:enoyl-CoA hydratase/isomerase family protein n=1 Tax=Alteribacillus sp. YIM 98480 TaxID=2606599 RepID=UPI00131E79CF|nr:enoyl-CoA hydratase/isomerase family protein [Alteribacillus sp. YIM 98480]
MENPIKSEISNGIGHLIFNRPNKRNALSTELIEQSTQALKEFENNPDVKIIIISGAGPAFSAGGDIATMQALNGPGEITSWMKKASQFTKTIVESNKYVIAAVNGFAAGAGFSLALACDFLISEKNAKFVSSFTNIGLIPDLGLTKFLTDRVPLQLAKEWIATGRALSAEELYEKGVINRLTDADVIKAAETFSELITKGSPLSQVYEKKLLNHAKELSTDAALQQEINAQTLLLQSEDHAEGVEAFLNKRKPAFNGK